MTQSNDKKTVFTGCCGWDFKGPMGSRKEISELMEQCCGEGGTFDCSKMMAMIKNEDGSFDVSRMMEMFKQGTLRPGSGQASGKWEMEDNEE